MKEYVYYSEAKNMFIIENDKVIGFWFNFARGKNDIHWCEYIGEL